MAYLVVPIDVEALCVNSQPIPAAQGFMPPITSFDSLPFAGQASQQPFLGEVAAAQPFNGGSSVGQPGVHLHWAMPDGLMHGTRPVNASGDPIPGSPMQFPRLPDRWLVTRTVLGHPELTRSWMVDSRYLAQTVSAATFNGGSNAIPWDNPNDPQFKLPPYRYLGRAVPLESWAGAQSGVSYLPELTAYSLAVIQAPAYYPNSRNVFGMYDTPAISQTFEACYSVCGWHAQASDDPLGGKNAADTARVLTARSWSATDGAVFDGVVYTGVVHSVVWDPNRPVATASPMTAVFGNNNNEALSALLAAAAGNAASALEPQVQALLSGQLDVLTESGGERRVTRQLHQQRFSPVVSGNLWFAARKTDGADLSRTLSAAHATLLQDLNNLEQAQVARRDEASSLQWQLFADWYKYMKCAYPQPGQDPPLDPDDVMDYIRANSLPAAQTAVAAAQTASAATARALTALQTALAAELEAAARPGPHYWKPADPVVLLSGNDVKPAMRYGGDGVLACRSGMLSALALPAGAVSGLGAASLDASASPGLGAGVGSVGTMTAQAQAALLEACLLWPAWAGAALATRAGKAQSAGAVAEWISAQAGGTGPGPWTGTMPSAVGVNLWSGNPWLPIMMHWRISYHPLAAIAPSTAAGAFKKDAVLTRLAAANDSLDGDEVDLVLTASTQGEIRQYEGINFITPQAGMRTAQQLQSYAAQHPGSALAGLAANAATAPLLSQSLSGFHDRLLLRRQTMQVEARDPFAQGQEVAFVRAVNQTLQALGTRVTTMAPMVQDAFNPVRGGGFDLDELLLVDVFGQFRSYPFHNAPNNTLLTARSLAPVEGTTARAFFPPRMSQPARLEFHWLSTDGDSILTPQQSPICGWVLPNYLDGSLAIYDAAGELLGSIMIIAGSLTWQGSPANPKTFGVPAETALASKNAQLRAFVLAFLRHGTDVQYLTDYLNTLNRVMNTIQPAEFAQNAQLPVLTGQPLALTRVSLKLNLMGAPAVNETWAAFAKDVEAAGGRTTNGHEEVRYPVLLGSVNDPDDGLAGFYFAGAADPFAMFYAVAGTGKGISPRKVQTVTLAASDAPTILTVLMDPRSAIHVTSGYTPSQSLSVPSESFQEAFGKIAVTFLTAPVLTMAPPPVNAQGSVSLPLPLPGQQKGRWSWVRVTKAADGTQTAVVAGAEALKPGQVLTNTSVYLQEGWLSLGGLED